MYLMFPGQEANIREWDANFISLPINVSFQKYFKTHIDEVFELLNPEEQKEFLELMYGNEDPQKNKSKPNIPSLPCLLQAMLWAKTMIEIGIKPKGMIGHSIGEVIAAVVAGVFELKDAVGDSEIPRKGNAKTRAWNHAVCNGSCFQK